MKPLSHSIINSTQSLLGRLTKVTTMGCMLALAFLMATSAVAQTSGKARPFKASGISTMNPDGTFVIVGTATHLGKFVFPGTYEIIPPYDNPAIVHFYIHGVYTAANGDTIEIECPDWVADFTVDPPTSTGLVEIISGTGRFANASGSYVGALSPAPVPTLFTAEGTISY